MSLQFNDTTNKSGIIQVCERKTKLGDGSISGNALKLKQFTSDINLTLDYIYAKIFQAGGTWQFDDSNHTDYPIITTNLVSGQRDYSFVTDEQGNLILDIYKVMVKGADGVYREITPVDVASEKNTDTFYDGRNTGGEPTRYDKMANSIHLDFIPNYNSTGGLKVYINREGSYFASTDTTKKAGMAGLFHEFLAIRPSYNYAADNSLPNTATLRDDMLRMENQIVEHYTKREKDVPLRLRPKVESTR